MANEAIRLSQTDLNAMLFCLGVLVVWSIVSFICILILSNRVETCENKLMVCERFFKWLDNNETMVARIMEPLPGDIPVAEACCDCANPDVCSECQMSCPNSCKCWCHGPKEGILED